MTKKATSQIEIASDEDVLAFGSANAEPVTAAPAEDQSQLLDLVRALQAKINDLEAAQAETARKVDSEYDMTDDYFFLARPHGDKWEERRIVNKRTVTIEMTATSFYGPFKTKEDIEVYLAAKRTKREDSDLDWGNVRVMTGRDARALRNREKAERDEQFGEGGSVNVLDRKIFAAAQGGHTPSMGSLIGPG